MNFSKPLCTVTTQKITARNPKDKYDFSPVVNYNVVMMKSFESRLTIFLSYSFIQRARTRARSFQCLYILIFFFYLWEIVYPK